MNRHDNAPPLADRLALDHEALAASVAEAATLVPSDVRTIATDEEAGEYVKGMTGWLEIYIKGEYQTPPEESHLVAFSGDVAEDPETWGPTLVTLRDARDEAVRKLMEKIGDDSA